MFVCLRLHRSDPSPSSNSCLNSVSPLRSFAARVGGKRRASINDWGLKCVRPCAQRVVHDFPRSEVRQARCYSTWDRLSVKIVTVPGHCHGSGKPAESQVGVVDGSGQSGPGGHFLPHRHQKLVPSSRVSVYHEYRWDLESRLELTRERH